MHERSTRFHRVTVFDENMIRTLKFERVRQSSMYLDAPFETDFEYPGYLHISLAVAPHATRTLVIGLGGGTVVKRMWRDYPEMSLDVVELDPEIVEIAHEYFELPDDERIRVYVNDGRTFLEECGETYDIIVVDAFDDDHIPHALLTEEFLRAARDTLSEDGVIAYNFTGSVHGDLSRPFRSFLRTLRNVWRRVWVFPIGIGTSGTAGDNRNIILLASDARLSDSELSARIASRVGGRVSIGAFPTFAEDLYEGPFRTGDVPILLDAMPPKPRGRRGR